MPETAQSTIVVIRHSPYGSTLARTALDIVLAAGAFEQSITVLLCGNGVLQLLPQQRGDKLGTKTLSKQLAALPLYDIEKVYAEQESIERFSVDINAAPLPVERVSAQQLHRLLAEHDHIVSL